MWEAKFYSGSKAKYLISSEHSTITVLSCNWEGCLKHKERKLSNSKNNDFPSSNGWLEVIDLHDGNLRLYLKKEGEMIKFVWLRPLTGIVETLLLRRGELQEKIIRFFFLF